MSKTAFPIFVCFLLNLAQNPTLLIPSSARSFLGYQSGLSIPAWPVDLWPEVSE